jgi:Aldehyde dehydrogenase family
MVPSKLRYYAADALTESGRVATPKPGSISMILRQLMGVAGVIAPWNSPVVLTIRSLAPALAAGCTAQSPGTGRAGRASDGEDHGGSPGFTERCHKCSPHSRDTGTPIFF